MDVIEVKEHLICHVYMLKLDLCLKFEFLNTNILRV